MTNQSIYDNYWHGAQKLLEKSGGGVSTIKKTLKEYKASSTV